MPRRAYAPDASDVVWLEFDPQAVHEQAGHHPALVIIRATRGKRAPINYAN